MSCVYQRYNKSNLYIILKKTLKTLHHQFDTQDFCFKRAVWIQRKFFTQTYKTRMSLENINCPQFVDFDSVEAFDIHDGADLFFGNFNSTFF